MAKGAGGDSPYTDTSVPGVPAPAKCSIWRGTTVTGEYGTVQGTTMTIRFVTAGGIMLDEAVITK